jgi:hemerythrin-like domain-containing protein
MYATQQLRSEHETIELAIKLLDYFSSKIEAEEFVSLDDLEQLIDFLETFLDQCHRVKEENYLFPALESVGVQKDNGPIGVMLVEHVDGCIFIHALRETFGNLRINDIKSRMAFVNAANGYSHRLRSHIQKENNCFAIADKQLPPEKHSEMTNGFLCIEQEHLGSEGHQRYSNLLDRLSNAYLRPTG